VDDGTGIARRYEQRIRPIGEDGRHLGDRRCDHRPTTSQVLVELER
jgi:hypothetical protein